MNDLMRARAEKKRVGKQTNLENKIIRNQVATLNKRLELVAQCGVLLDLGSEIVSKRNVLASRSCCQQRTKSSFPRTGRTNNINVLSVAASKIYPSCNFKKYFRGFVSCCLSYIVLG